MYLWSSLVTGITRIEMTTSYNFGTRKTNFFFNQTQEFIFEYFLIRENKYSKEQYHFTLTPKINITNIS